MLRNARAKSKMEKWTVRITHKYVYFLLSFEVNALRISFLVFFFIIIQKGLSHIPSHHKASDEA